MIRENCVLYYLPSLEQAEKKVCAVFEDVAMKQKGIFLISQLMISREPPF
jgi:hypothetical protein